MNGPPEPPTHRDARTTDRRARVLLVDDEESVIKTLVRLLRREPYDLITASSGAEALALLQSHTVAVILCDQWMPGMSGPEVLARSSTLQPDAYRITLTGHTDVESAQQSINEGRVHCFLTKPWEDDHLRRVVAEGVRTFNLLHENRNLHGLTLRQKHELAARDQMLERKVHDRTAALRAAYEETLHALMLALDTRERETAGHSRRVTVYCVYLAMKMEIEPTALEDIYRGALLHDIGKIGVPDAILLKQGKLTDKERRVIQTHVDLGGRILEGIGHLKTASEIPRFHHERFDGTGYASGASGPAIPLSARIFTVVDVYDALRSERSYKAALPHDEALATIDGDAGTHFDPAVVAAFRKVTGATWDGMAASADATLRFDDVLDLCWAAAPTSAPTHDAAA